MDISVRSVLHAAIVFAGDSKLFVGKCVDYSPDRYMTPYPVAVFSSDFLRCGKKAQGIERVKRPPQFLVALRHRPEGTHSAPLPAPQ
jgi:hypothetical protein